MPTPPNIHQLAQMNHQLSQAQRQNSSSQRLFDTSATQVDGHVVLINSHFEVVLSDSRFQAASADLTHFLRHDTDVDYLNLVQPLTLAYGDQMLHIRPLASALSENKAFVGLLVAAERTVTPLVELTWQPTINMVSLVNAQIDFLKATDAHDSANFFNHIMSRNFTTTALRDYQTVTEKQAHSRYTVAMIAFSKSTRPVARHQLIRQQQLVRWFIDEHRHDILLSDYQQQLLLIINAENPTPPRQLLNTLANFMRVQGQPFWAGFSRDRFSLEKLADGYDQAADALTLASASHPIMRFHPKTAQELLGLLPQQDRERFIQQTLGSVLGYPELLETLDKYIFLEQNVTDVSKTLFLHRNTVHHRLTKIAQILDVDLTMPDILADIRLALMLRRV